MRTRRLIQYFVEVRIRIGAGGFCYSINMTVGRIENVDFTFLDTVFDADFFAVVYAAVFQYFKTRFGKFFRKTFQRILQLVGDSVVF